MEVNVVTVKLALSAVTLKPVCGITTETVWSVSLIFQKMVSFASVVFNVFRK